MALDSWKTVQVTLVDGIAWVELNRPAKRNAMSPELNAEMIEVLTALDADDACGVVVLTGAGEAFSAGMDLKEYFREVDGAPDSVQRRVRRDSALWQWRLLRTYAKPTIAMVNGWGFGGAFTPLVSCDLAIAAALSVNPICLLLLHRVAHFLASFAHVLARLFHRVEFLLLRRREDQANLRHGVLADRLDLLFRFLPRRLNLRLRLVDDRRDFRLLIRRQDRANLAVFLGTDILAALHYLAGLFHVGTRCNGITLLARRAGRIHERLGLRAKRFVLRLILRANRLDLRFLRIGQVEIGAESAASASATLHLSGALRARRGSCG